MHIASGEEFGSFVGGETFVSAHTETDLNIAVTDPVVAEWVQIYGHSADANAIGQAVEHGMITEVQASRIGQQLGYITLI